MTDEIKSFIIKPIRNFVYIKPIKQMEGETQSGILLPRSAQQKYMIGEIVASGKEVDSVLSKGQKVIYDAMSGEALPIPRNNIVVMRDIDVKMPFNGTIPEPEDIRPSLN